MRPKTNLMIVLASFMLLYLAVSVSAAVQLSPAAGGIISGDAVNVSANASAAFASNTTAVFYFKTDTPSSTWTQICPDQTNVSADQQTFECTFKASANTTMDRLITLNVTFLNASNNSEFIEDDTNAAVVVNDTVLTATLSVPASNAILTSEENSFTCVTSEESNSATLSVNERSFSLTGNTTHTGWTRTLEQSELPEGTYTATCSAADLDGASAVSSSDVKFSVDTPRSRSKVHQQIAAEAAGKKAGGNWLWIIIIVVIIIVIAAIVS